MERLKDQKADQKRLSPGTSFGDRSLQRFRLRRGADERFYIVSLAPLLLQQQDCSGIYSALCTKLCHVTACADVSTLLEGVGGLMMIALDGLCLRLPFRASMFVTVATKINARHGTEWSFGS